MATKKKSDSDTQAGHHAQTSPSRSTTNARPLAQLVGAQLWLPMWCSMTTLPRPTTSA